MFFILPQMEKEVGMIFLIRLCFIVNQKITRYNKEKLCLEWG